jgi:hypothetical protein
VLPAAKIERSLALIERVETLPRLADLIAELVPTS